MSEIDSFQTNAEVASSAPNLESSESGLPRRALLRNIGPPEIDEAHVWMSKVGLTFPTHLDDTHSIKVAMLRAAGLTSKHLNKRPKVVLRGINFHARPGDRIGILGRNGAGKTTLLRMIAGIYEPEVGRFQRNGSIVPLLNIMLGMDGFLSGLENIYARGRYIGLSKVDMESRVNDIVEFCELGDDILRPVRTYSSGMVARLAFAIATSVRADIYVMDEWIGAGDARFFDRAAKRVENWIHDDTIVFLGTHSDGLVREWCNSVLVLERGGQVAWCDVEEGIALKNKILLEP